jgi:hypothetical protein
MRVFLLALLTCAFAQAQEFSFTVAPAPEWNARLRCDQGWTGADGIFSFREPRHGKTLFVFSDTWIGSVDPKTRVRRDMRLINNSMAVMDGEQIHFLWNKADARAAFVPRRANSWYWLQDGFIHGDQFYNFPMIVEKDKSEPPGFQFKTIGVELLKIPLTRGQPDLRQATRHPVPLFAKKRFFGAGVMHDTDAGFVYVYGRLHRHFSVDLMVARVPPDRVAEPAAWRFWDGSAWVPDLRQAASLGPGGPELSVTPMAEGPLAGKYLLVTMPVSREIFIRVADRPEGPFGRKITIYRTTEPDEFPGAYTYNAKAHPAVSPRGALLISYNVNAPNLSAHKQNADIYRPRFITLRIHR